MIALTVFGGCAVALMMMFYSLEERATWYKLAFAVSCVAASACGWMAGAWPCGVIESVWAIVAFRNGYAGALLGTFDSFEAWGRVHAAWY
jgi:hypothetical protein